MNFDEYLNSLFGEKSPEEIQKENEKLEQQWVEENPPLIMSFGKFAEGNFDDGRRNLYIVWRGKQALYVGISRSGIWHRWFSRGSQAHIHVISGQWHTDFSSPIGRAIIYNRPASLRWKIELRYIPLSQSLNTEEANLIYEMHPLFNTTYLPSLTPREQKIYKQLTKKEVAEMLGSIRDVDFLRESEEHKP